MKKFFNIFCIVYIFTICFSYNGYAQDNVVDEIAWVVGDEIILRSDIEEARLQLQYDREKTTGDPYCVIPEQMALQKLFLHQAKLDSINVTDADVMQMVDYKYNYFLNQSGSVEKLEEYARKSANQFRQELRETEKEQETVRQVRRKLIGDVKVTPAEVRKYFSQLPQDSLPFIQTTVEVEILTIQPKIPMAEIDDIKARLREYSDKATKGEMEFSTLARLWSEDPGSAANGGEYGFMGKGMLDPEFAAVAFSLNDPKKVSKIVETEYGYHIIQLIERRGDRISYRHILLKPKVSQKEIKEATLHLDSIANDIKAGKFSFEDGAYLLSYDKETRNNKGLMVNKEESSQYYGTPKFQMQELPQEVGRVVKNMQPGDVSKPFTMLTEKQKEVIAIVKLKIRTEGHKANLSDDYLTLKDIVENHKKDEIIRAWITKKQKETYIRINESWRNCDFQMDGWVR